MNSCFGVGGKRGGGRSLAFFLAELERGESQKLGKY